MWSIFWVVVILSLKIFHFTDATLQYFYEQVGLNEYILTFEESQKNFTFFCLNQNRRIEIEKAYWHDEIDTEIEFKSCQNETDLLNQGWKDETKIIQQKCETIEKCVIPPKMIA